MSIKFRFPSKQTIAKWVVGTFVTILLGAIGSGVWQHLLGPGFQWGSRTLLNIASLGFQSYRDSVYQEIAKDNLESANIETLRMATLIVWFLFFTSLSLLFVTA